MTAQVDLAQVRARLTQARARQLGFPAATDIDFSAVAWINEDLSNNLGNPESDTGRWPVHTKDVEREVVARHARLFGGSTGRRGTSFGYVTAGGASEGVLHGMWLGRRRYPDARVYHSSAAHVSTASAADLLGLAVTVVGVDDTDEIDYTDLGRKLFAHRDEAALVVLTAGTTMTEAVDDVAAVHQVLDEAGTGRRHIVVDAALSGPALAACGDSTTAYLLAEHGDYPSRGRIDADYVVNSGQKSWATPHVCAVGMTRREHLGEIGRPVDYLVDTLMTVSGSRPGQSPVELLHAWDAIGGADALARRAHAARGVADYAVTRLASLHWPAWRHPHAWTVVLDAPALSLCRRWALPESNGRAHLICMPGITRADIDEFAGELAAELHRPPLPRENTA